MRTIQLLFIPLLLSFGAAAQPTAFSLEEAQEYALLHSLEAENAVLDQKIAKALVVETRSTGLPQISGSADLNWYVNIPTTLVPAAFAGGSPDEFVAVQFGTKYNLTASVSASQLIFDGSYFVGLKAAKTYAELAQKQVDLTERDVVVNVEKAYYSALLSKVNLEYLEQNLVEVEQQLAETRAMYDEGFVEELDVDRVELSVNELANQISALTRQTDAALLLLKFQMNYPFDQELVLEDSLEQFVNEFTVLTPELENIIRNRLEYRVLDIQEELYQLDKKRWLASYLPRLSAIASYQQVAQRNEFNFLEGDEEWFPTSIVGLSLQLPIFDGLYKAAKIQQAKLEREKVENQMEQLEQRIALEVTQAADDYESAWERYLNAQDNVELAENIYRKTQIKYESGVGSSLEVSTARNDLYRAQTAYFIALYDLLVSKVEYQKAIGAVFNQ